MVCACCCFHLAKLSQLLGFEPPEGIEGNSPTGQADRKLMNRTKSTIKSSNSGATHKTGYLEVPALDLREERFVQRGANGALKEMNKKRPQGSLRKNKVIESCTVMIYGETAIQQ